MENRDTTGLPWRSVLNFGPFQPIIRPQLRFLPLVAVLGLLASVFEGIGIGTLIPFVAVLLAGSRPELFDGPLGFIPGAIADWPLSDVALVFAAVVIAFMLLKGIVQVLNNLLISRLHSQISRALMDRLADRAATVDYRFFLANDGSRLLNIISDDSWNVAELVKILLLTIPALAGLAVFAVLLAWLNLPLFLIVMAGSLLILLALLALVRVQRRLSMAMMRDNRTLGQRMMEIITSARTIRLFGQQSREQDRFSHTTGLVFAGVHRIEKLTALIGPSLDFMLAVIFLAILLTGYLMGTSAPEVVAFVLLMSRAQPHASLLLHARSELAARRGATSEVEWLLGQSCPAAAPGQESAAPRMDQPITFESISYRYPDGSMAVSDASFTITPGVPTALIGNSGAGKTTIVNLLTRLLEPDGGRILVGNTPFGLIDPHHWRNQLAVAGQDTCLFEGSVAQNIAYGRPVATRTEIEEAAEAAGAARFIAELDHGFDTMVGEQGVKLSGGQRQRVGLARALLRRPSLLILDEATSSVDSPTEADIMRLITEGRFFDTLLVITHRQQTLAHCEYGIVMDHSAVVEAGLLSGLGYYRSMQGKP